MKIFVKISGFRQPTNSEIACANATLFSEQEEEGVLVRRKMAHAIIHSREDLPEPKEIHALVEDFKKQVCAMIMEAKTVRYHDEARVADL